MFVREALESKAIAGAFAALRLQNHVLANHPLGSAYQQLRVCHHIPLPHVWCAILADAFLPQT